MTLDQLIGQERPKRLIRAEAAANKLFRPTLLSGPPGLGKTSLARAIANLTKAEFVPFTAAPGWDARKIESELLKLDTTGYQQGGIRGPGAKRFVFFVDEIHLMRNYEPFYEPLTTLQVILATGGYAWIPDTTFIFATSKLSALPKPFRDRCPVKLRIDPYSEGDLTQIIGQRFPKMDSALRSEIARRSRGTARLALDYAESVQRHGGLGFFEDAEIDAYGLAPLDRDYLGHLRAADRPLSINTLASLVGETKETLEDIVEPFLLSLGMIAITSKGRIPVGTERGPRATADVFTALARPSRAKKSAIAT
jgi:Holliday junction DNA helicase RuvB